MAGYGKIWTDIQKETDTEAERIRWVYRQADRDMETDRETNKEEADTETCKKTYIQTDK